jgi:hypothetical protein
MQDTESFEILTQKSRKNGNRKSKRKNTDSQEGLPSDALRALKHMGSYSFFGCVLYNADIQD